MKKNSHKGIIIVFYVLLFASCYGEIVEGLIRQGVSSNRSAATGLLLAIVNIALVSLIMLAIPYALSKKHNGKIPYKKGKRICLWNSIGLFVLSSVLLVLTRVGLIGGIGAVLFYFINKWLYVEDFEEVISKGEAPISQKLEGHTTDEYPSYICLSNSEETTIHKRGNFYSDDIILKVSGEMSREYAAQTNCHQEARHAEIRFGAARCSRKRFCSRCGAKIDSVTKKCTGCDRQYFKGIRINKVSITIMILALIIVATSTLCVTQHVEEQKLKSEIIDLETRIFEKQSRISMIEEKNNSLRNQIMENIDLVNFIDDHVVFIEDDGSELYHKFECYKFKGESFWVYNTEAAKVNGYKQCSQCF